MTANDLADILHGIDMTIRYAIAAGFIFAGLIGKPRERSTT